MAMAPPPYNSSCRNGAEDGSVSPGTYRALAKYPHIRNDSQSTLDNSLWVETPVNPPKIMPDMGSDSPISYPSSPSLTTSTRSQSPVSSSPSHTTRSFQSIDTALVIRCVPPASSLISTNLGHISGRDAMICSPRPANFVHGVPDVDTPSDYLDSSAGKDERGDERSVETLSNFTLAHIDAR